MTFSWLPPICNDVQPEDPCSHSLPDWLQSWWWELCLSWPRCGGGWCGPCSWLLQGSTHGQKAGLGSMWSTTKKRWSNSTIMGLGYQTVPQRICLEDIMDNCFIVILLLIIAEYGGRGSWRESSVRLQCHVSPLVHQDFIAPNILSNIVQSTLNHKSVSIHTHHVYI